MPEPIYDRQAFGSPTNQFDAIADALGAAEGNAAKLLRGGASSIRNQRLREEMEQAAQARAGENLTLAERKHALAMALEGNKQGGRINLADFKNELSAGQSNVDASRDIQAAIQAAIDAEEKAKRDHERDLELAKLRGSFAQGRANTLAGNRQASQKVRPRYATMTPQKIITRAEETIAELDRTGNLYTVENGKKRKSAAYEDALKQKETAQKELLKIKTEPIYRADEEAKYENLESSPSYLEDVINSKKFQ